MGGRGVRLREPLRELLLRRPAADRPGAGHDRRRRAGPPRPLPLAGRGMSRMLARARAALVVVDVPEAVRGAVGEFDAIARAAGVLAPGSRLLGLPIVVT